MGKNKIYPIELKMQSVQLYENEGYSYKTVAKMLGIADASRVKAWVKKHRKGESFEDMRGKSRSPQKGRRKSVFSSVEEELAYVKAERDYLKKRYPNLHGEVSPK